MRKDQQNLELVTKLFTKLKKIKRLQFDTPNHEWANQLFERLNSCEKLKKLEWNSKYCYGPSIITQQMVMVIQKLNYLKLIMLISYNSIVKWII